MLFSHLLHPFFEVAVFQELCLTKFFLHPSPPPSWLHVEPPILIILVDQHKIWSSSFCNPKWLSCLWCSSYLLLLSHTDFPYFKPTPQQPILMETSRCIKVMMSVVGEDFWRWQTMNPNGYRGNSNNSASSENGRTSVIINGSELMDTDWAQLWEPFVQGGFWHVSVACNFATEIVTYSVCVYTNANTSTLHV